MMSITSSTMEKKLQTRSNRVQRANSSQHISSALCELVLDLESRMDKKEATVVRTGIHELEPMISGLHPGELCVIAGRPAMGKSNLAFRIARHVAVNEKLPVIVFSMSMSAQQISQRMLCQQAKIDPYNLQRFHLEHHDWEKISIAIEQLKSADLYLDDTPCLSIKQIQKRALNVYEKHGRIGLIVVDDLHVLRQIKKWGQVMASLQDIANGLNTPMVLLSGLRRELEFRGDKRPKLTDLPSHKIAQYSELLLFVYRDEIYNHEAKPLGVVEVICERNQHGAVGTTFLAHDYAETF